MPSTGTINNNGLKLNISIGNKWDKSGKYLSITPNVPLRIEFDFEKGTMDKTTFFVHERINGVWEPGADRDGIWNIQDGHHVMELNLTGDYIRIYFEKGTSTDDGTVTTCYVDNFRLTQNDLEVIEENNYYPFGLKHKGYNNVINGTDHPYGYNGKEEQDELGLNWIDYGARNYDAALGRWMNIDNKSEVYKSLSVYHYAGNNPILNYDIDGNEFTESAWRWVNKLINEINSRQNSNNEKIAEKQAELGQDGLSDRKIRRLNRQISDLKKNNSELEGVRGEIAFLEASDQVYNVAETSERSESGPISGMGTTISATGFNFSTGAVDIDFDRTGGVRQFAHELKHAYQFEVGEISFGPRVKGFYFGIDKHDELEGFNRGALFGGPSYNSIHNLPKTYEGLSDGPYNKNSVPQINQALQQDTVEKQKRYLQVLSTGVRHAFRINGTTYYNKK